MPDGLILPDGLFLAVYILTFDHASRYLEGGLFAVVEQLMLYGWWRNS